MLSALDNRRHDPNDVVEISPDVVLVARSAADFPSLAPDAAGRNAQMDATHAATPTLDATFRPSDTSGEHGSRGKWLRSTAIAFLFALTSAFGAAAWERYGGDTQSMLAGLSPHATLTSWLPTSVGWLMPGRAAVAAQSDAPVAQPAAADPSAQPAAPQTTGDAAPATASPDTAQLLQSMARDVASLNQQIGELKARMAELKAGQEQLGRDMARAPEPKMSEAKPAEPRPAKLGAPPRPLGTLVAPVHRPRPPTTPPAQAAYMPPPPTAAAPVQIAPAPPPAAARPDMGPVVRPPMPVE